MSKTKAHNTPKSISDKRKWMILDDYMSGLKVKDLAEKYNMYFVTMEKFLTITIKKLNMVRETNALVNAQKIEKALSVRGVKSVKVSYNDPKLINEKFLELLSDPESAELNEVEKTYCVMFAQTGNNKKAILAAGLDVAINTTDRIQSTVDHVIMLRGYYLRNRPLVASAINTLQEYNMKALNVDKDFVQLNLVQNIEELREEVVDSPKARSHLLKSIELLGKTIGAFQENIRVEQIDPADGLRTLIEMTKKHETGDYEQSPN